MASITVSFFKDGSHLRLRARRGGRDGGGGDVKSGISGGTGLSALAREGAAQDSEGEAKTGTGEGEVPGERTEVSTFNNLLFFDVDKLIQLDSL